jgi:hypothetical protein
MSATTKIKKLVRAVGAFVGMKPLQTGQLASFRTDDNFDSGRLADYFTLSSNNPFGNTSRFTDVLGGSTYTNNVVVDWSTWDGVTVTCWLRTKQTAVGWNAAVDNAVLVNAGGFSSGWKIPTLNEHLQIVNTSKSRALNYAPFSDSSNDKFWTGTTFDSYSLPAAYLNQYGYLLYAIATVYPWRPIREYTLADLGL